MMMRKAARAETISTLEIRGFRRVEKVALLPPSFWAGSYILDRLTAKTGLIMDIMNILHYFARVRSSFVPMANGPAPTLRSRAPFRVGPFNIESV